MTPVAIVARNWPGEDRTYHAPRWLLKADHGQQVVWLVVDMVERWKKIRKKWAE